MHARSFVTLAFVAAIFGCSSIAPDATLDAGSTADDLSPLEVPTNDVPSTEAPKHDDLGAPHDEPLVAHADVAPEPRHALLPSTELDDLVVPDVVSTAPTEGEWLAAKRLHTTSGDCMARFVREWTTIVCSLGGWGGQYPLGLVRVMAGDPKDVGTWTWIPKPKNDTDLPNIYVAAVFPVRPGDRRILELTFEHMGAKSAFNRAAAFTISEVWLEGMPSPEISVTR